MSATKLLCVLFVLPFSDHSAVICTWLPLERSNSRTWLLAVWCEVLVQAISPSFWQLGRFCLGQFGGPQLGRTKRNSTWAHTGVVHSPRSTMGTPSLEAMLTLSPRARSPSNSVTVHRRSTCLDTSRKSTRQTTGWRRCPPSPTLTPVRRHRHPLGGRLQRLLPLPGR